MPDQSDPAFPTLHGRPPRGWVNDPNGCSFIDGRYHVFFQHNPDAPVHAGIKWGHASSTDLVHWRQEPVALTNRAGEADEYGCWSGCVVDDDGVLTAVYSAVADDSFRADVLLAYSDRQMRTWRQTHEPVARTPDDPAISHVRDPFVVRIDGHRYAIQGAGHTLGHPRILIHGCDDLSTWTDLGTFLSGDDPIAAEVAPANIWECPNLVQFGDRWVLIVSLWHRVDGSYPLVGVRYLVGDVQVGADGPRFTPTSGGHLDRGPCFYAPQVLAVDGRVLMWAWSWERGRTDEEVVRAGWAGALTYCRELTLVGDILVSRPARELVQLRRQPLRRGQDGSITAAAFDIDLDPAAGRASLWLVDGADEQLITDVDLHDGPGAPRVLVDGSMVEIFDGSGTSFTTRAYPTATSRWKLLLDGPHQLQGWRLFEVSGG
jgi:beta-fructofuranosidase